MSLLLAMERCSCRHTVLLAKGVLADADRFELNIKKDQGRLSKIDS